MPTDKLYCEIVGDAVFESNIYDEPAIDEWKIKWDSGIVSYGVIRKSTKSKAIMDWEDRALTIALRTWGLRIKNIKFRRQRNIDLNNPPDIILRFRKRDEDSLFKEKPSVLAYAYFPTSSPIGGDITFNDDYIWSKDGKSVSAHEYDPVTYPDPTDTTTLRTWNIMHTLIHECGHALGLKHNMECSDCIMYPYYNAMVTLHDNDIERIQNFYGARVTAWWHEYFRKRMYRRFNGVRPNVL